MAHVQANHLQTRFRLLLAMPLAKTLSNNNLETGSLQLGCAQGVNDVLALVSSP